MDQKVVLKWFEKFPKLETFIAAGTISSKMARDILEIDRYDWYDIYLELIMAGAVFSTGGGGFRATPELKEFLEERKNVSNEK